LDEGAWGGAGGDEAYLREGRKIGLCGNIPQGMVSRRERAGEETHSERAFLRPREQRDAVGFGYTAFALWDEGNMIPTKD
jgi:hypothetical protein